MHIRKSPLPLCMRASSPASDSGASSLSPVASSASFALDNVAGVQDEEPQYVSVGCSHGSTPLSSPSKSCQSCEHSPVHHPACRSILHDRGIYVYDLDLFLHHFFIRICRYFVCLIGTYLLEIPTEFFLSVLSDFHFYFYFWSSVLKAFETNLETLV